MAKRLLRSVNREVCRPQGGVFVSVGAGPVQDADLNAAVNLDLRAITAPDRFEIHSRVRSEWKADRYITRETRNRFGPTSLGIDVNDLVAPNEESAPDGERQGLGPLCGGQFKRVLDAVPRHPTFSGSQGGNGLVGFTKPMNPSSYYSSRSSRRRFLRGTLAASGALALPSLVRAEAKQPVSETLAATLHASLTPEQREKICFPFAHPLRSEVDNNWHITEPRIGTFLDADQQQMVREIFLNLHSEQYRDEVMKQVEQDGGRGGGFKESSIALFGEPGAGGFEFVLTGRHVTRRCDGDSVAGKAFGGPIFYGHAAKSFTEPADHPGNVYWFQAVRANEVYAMLDGKQREKALLDTPRGERGTKTVELKRDGSGIEGIAVADLTPDQKNHVRKVLADLLMPFRAEDVTESLALIEKVGLDRHHLAFYKAHDIGGDGIWDTWQLEGPGMVWHFRGKPHVHTWVHIADPDVPESTV